MLYPSTTPHTIKVNKSMIAKVDHANVIPFIDWNIPSKGYIQEQPGKEHYKLLTYLMKMIVESGVANPRASDLGTLYGTSALALVSAHPSVQVTTYDVNNAVPAVKGVNTINNMTSIKRKIMSAQLDIGDIAKSHLVFLDIDPHNGIEELKIVNELVERGYKGLLLANGINVNEGMREFWKIVCQNKALTTYDVSSIGHWTGTGLINFSSDCDVTIE